MNAASACALVLCAAAWGARRARGPRRALAAAEIGLLAAEGALWAFGDAQGAGTLGVVGAAGALVLSAHGHAHPSSPRWPAPAQGALVLLLMALSVVLDPPIWARAAGTALGGWPLAWRALRRPWAPWAAAAWALGTSAALARAELAWGAALAVHWAHAGRHIWTELTSAFIQGAAAPI